MISQSVTSLEYVAVKVTAAVGGTTTDPTSDPVAFAIVAEGTTPGSYTAGSWFTGSDGYHYARILVGPGGTLSPAAGRWHVWVKVTDAPEIPARDVGVLIIT